MQSVRCGARTALFVLLGDDRRKSAQAVERLEVEIVDLCGTRMDRKHTAEAARQTRARCTCAMDGLVTTMYGKVCRFRRRFAIRIGSSCRVRLGGNGSSLEAAVTLRHVIAIGASAPCCVRARLVHVRRSNPPQVMPAGRPAGRAAWLAGIWAVWWAWTALLEHEVCTLDEL
jgi:hypothetical protein